MNRSILKYGFLILFSCCYHILNAQGNDTSNIALPSWTFYQGDSIIGEGNCESQIKSRPEVSVNINSNKDLVIRFKTNDYRPSEMPEIRRVSICLNNNTIALSTRYGFKESEAGYYENTFPFEISILQNKLKHLKGKKLKINFQDYKYQTTLGYLDVN